jgi:hypothetical protein
LEIGEKALVGGGIGLGAGLVVQGLLSPTSAYFSSDWKEKPHQLEIEEYFPYCGNTY